MVNKELPRYCAQLNVARMSVDVFDFAFGGDHKPGEIMEAVAYLKDWEAQVLLDDLWAAGVRPSKGVASAGAMDEAHDHLDSLKRMLWGKP